MHFLSLAEAQLFRQLVGLFGEDRVIPQMSAMAVCGGNLPRVDQDFELTASELAAWARAARCLFTVVDHNDDAKLVVEFFSGFEPAIDVIEAEHQRYLRPILEAAGIRYVTIAPDDFCEMLDPASGIDLVGYLQASLE